MSVQRIAQVIGIKPDQIEEYERIHADVWPTVLATIKKANIQITKKIWPPSPQILKLRGGGRLLTPCKAKFLKHVLGNGGTLFPKTFTSTSLDCHEIISSAHQ
jgi:hypothetical protein